MILKTNNQKANYTTIDLLCYKSKIAKSLESIHCLGYQQQQRL
jgi:hypothetical protein